MQAVAVTELLGIAKHMSVLVASILWNEMLMAPELKSTSQLQQQST